MSRVISMDIYLDFLDLPCAASAVEFKAIRLSPKRQDFLAKASDGSPVFLLHDSSAIEYSPSISLKNMSVQFHSTCRVCTNSSMLEDQFAVVTCEDSVPELYELFVRCFAAAVERLPISANTRELNECVRSLLDLFRALSSPSSREVTGLWAELYIIFSSCRIPQALSAWHVDRFDRFDFSWSFGRLEVKATVKELRVHEFALEQLQLPINGHGFVASILLQPLNGGVSVLDLARRIEENVLGEPLLRQKLWQNVASALGCDFSDALDRQFDISYAERHILLYSMRDVPAPSQPSDARITSIRFRSDLSSVETSLVGKPSKLLNHLFTSVVTKPI